MPSSITEMEIEVSLKKKGFRGTIMQKLWNAAKFFALFLSMITCFFITADLVAGVEVEAADLGILVSGED